MKKQMITAAMTLGIFSFGFVNQADAHEITYKVQLGDTLWKIASTNNLTVNQLTQYNQLSSSTIYVGQVLKVPTTTQQAPTKPTTTTKTYTVQPGDTLWKVATSNKLTVAQLKSINNFTSDTIHAGQVLKLIASTTSIQDKQPSFHADALIAEGKKYIGVPYKWGGTTPQGFDCSGFLHYIFNTQGIAIPRTVATIWNAGTSVAAPQKGDIVFFNTYAPGASHAGIYLGDNKFLHASSSIGVTVSDLNNSYWKPRYLGAKAFR